MIAGDQNMVGAEAGIDGAHLLETAQKGARYSEQHQSDGNLRDHKAGTQPGMARCPRCGGDALFETFDKVGPQRREGRGKTAQGSRGQCEQQREGDHAGVHGDGIDARHRLRQQVQGEADGGGSKCQAQQAPGQAEQQACADGFEDDDAGTRAQGQAHSVLPAAADGSDQQQACDIDACNQQHNGYGEEQRPQQRADLSDRVLA